MNEVVWPFIGLLAGSSLAMLIAELRSKIREHSTLTTKPNARTTADSGPGTV